MRAFVSPRNTMAPSSNENAGGRSATERGRDLSTPPSGPSNPSPPIRRWRRFASFGLRILAVITLVLAVAWASAAIYFDGPAARYWAAILSAALPVACLAAFRLIKRFWLAILADVGLFAVVLLWWLFIPPRNDRAWQPDVARPARAESAGSLVTIHNVRNFDYRGNDDFTENWETRTYDLDQVVGVDLFLSFWGPTLIAHTITSWEFADGRHLAVSIETRKEVGEEYSAVRGFFRQFEIYYVVADERDVVGLRAAQRGERVYLYRIKATPDVARALLTDYLEKIDALAAKPQWYNALTDNCTTAIRYHFKQIGDVRSLSWKIFLNGYLDELLYERGQIDTSLPFPELKRQSEITERARGAAGDPAFSSLIRGHPSATANR